MDPIRDTHRQDVVPPATPITYPGDVSWVTADPVIDQMINEGVGVKVRIKVDKPQSRKRGGEVCEESQTKRCIFSLEGKGLKPGRRIAEVQSMMVDAPGLTDPMEVVKVTVWGKGRSLFGRERLSDGQVQTREEALKTLRELAVPQVLSRDSDKE
ncbi:MAG: hypothetical protein KDD55_00095 [Bdellovibrionales bacterium]|nr:hypothetical protein [Bdellovibrionales bacterium]